MKQIGKKLLSATLSALMIVSALSACGSSPSDAAETSAPASESSSASADSQSTEIPKTGTATGAYVQESMSENLPDTYSRFYDLRIDQDGNVLLVGLNSTGKRQLLQFESSTWTVLQESDMPANAPNYVDIADDGSIWAVTRNSDGQYSLCTGQDANALELVEVDSLLQSGALPVGLRLTDDGKVFLTVQVAESTIFVLIDCATRQVTTITPGFYGSPVLYSEGKVYAFVTGSTNLTVFDANSGNTLQQYQLPLAPLLHGEICVLLDDRIGCIGYHRAGILRSCIITVSLRRSAFSQHGSAFLLGLRPRLFQRSFRDSPGCIASRHMRGWLFFNIFHGITPRHKLFKLNFKIVQTAFKFYTQVAAIISLVIKTNAGSIPHTTAP